MPFAMMRRLMGMRPGVMGRANIGGPRLNRSAMRSHLRGNLLAARGLRGPALLAHMQGARQNRIGSMLQIVRAFR